MPQYSQPAFVDSSPSLKMIDGLIMRGAPGRLSVRALDTDAFTVHSTHGTWSGQSALNASPRRMRPASLAIGAIVVAAFVGVAIWAMFVPDAAAALPAVDRWFSSLGAS